MNKLQKFASKHIVKVEIATLVLMLAATAIIEKNTFYNLSIFSFIIIFLTPFLVFLTFLYSKVNRDLYSVLALIISLPLMFAWLYLYIEQGECLVGAVGEAGYNYIYFSYSTFTTLGYGDITPVGICRMLSSLEAVTGYIFMAYVAALFYKRLN